eukprot:scaffold86675_cov22-Tisochrysis_lutea.AAC.4
MQMHKQACTSDHCSTLSLLDEVWIMYIAQSTETNPCHQSTCACKSAVAKCAIAAVLLQMPASTHFCMRAHMCVCVCVSPQSSSFRQHHKSTHLLEQLERAEPGHPPQRQALPAAC